MLDRVTVGEVIREAKSERTKPVPMLCEPDTDEAVEVFCTVLRYRHDVVSGESLNVGVVMHAPAPAMGVGAGVFEYRIDFGPGYRIYSGRDGGTLTVLPGGGTKVRRQRDIEAARHLWREYRRRTRRQD